MFGGEILWQQVMLSADKRRCGYYYALCETLLPWSPCNGNGHRDAVTYDKSFNSAKDFQITGRHKRFAPRNRDAPTHIINAVSLISSACYCSPTPSPRAAEAAPVRTRVPRRRSWRRRRGHFWRRKVRPGQGRRLLLMQSARGGRR